MVEAADLYNIDIEENVPSAAELTENFKTIFVSASSVNHGLIDKHYTTDDDGSLTCNLKLKAIDPSVQPPCCEYKAPTTEILLQFPILNGEFHAVHEKLSASHD